MTTTTTTAFKACTAGRYDDMLNVVPPAISVSYGFLVGEASSYRVCRVNGHNATTFPAVIRSPDGKRFLEAIELMTAAEFRALTKAELLAAFAGTTPR